ncbi:MAG: hypothetical protein KDH96_00145 [Candidatus Riesia sp.]|nr:hypothetical protein [Candidatus Riesia sp.]
MMKIEESVKKCPYNKFKTCIKSDCAKWSTEILFNETTKETIQDSRCVDDRISPLLIDILSSINKLHHAENSTREHLGKKSDDLLKFFGKISNIKRLDNGN